ncbi:CCA tRNA nucleotidyltransferase [Cytobacillus gottheilii]|uniref:CCA tRNA nucleotidyltransferase n=1 Tax=Cytobacillus gottheilii TaxID=859144 RepID=UPI0009BAF8DD|nr:CCA tRNA nucleotidyltransferase [Cytobacillus gottheilii]
MNPEFQKAKSLLVKIEEAGFEAYFVGGSVRDDILGKTIADVDIATSALPEEIKGIFSKTIDIGLEHGTVAVLHEGIPYEITTFRAEAEYKDFRRPSEVFFIRSLNEDLGRRDFTMNAIAMDAKGALIDPFHGVDDIHRNVIQTVGNAEERFKEDALRMMRAVRFHSQLSFEISEDTMDALIRNVHLLEHIAVERKLAEFEKLLSGANINGGIRVLAESGLFHYLPGLQPYMQQLIQFAVIEKAALHIEERWALLLHLLKQDAREAQLFLKSWRLPGKRIKTILSILSWLDVRLQSAWQPLNLYHCGYQTAISVEKLFNILTGSPAQTHLEEVIDQYQALPMKSKNELLVSGNDLMQWLNKQAGAWLKTDLQSIEEAIIQKKLPNDKDSIKEWLMKCNQSSE